MPIRTLFVLLPLTMAAATPALAGDAQAGRQKALQCQTCHGMDGLAKIPAAPNLAGQPEDYLIKSLTDYKTGARKNEMMSVVAPGLSEIDIADLAAYFNSIEVEVKPRP
ncbi:cytochrome c [Azospirillum sp. SYSU D00513]|uniref:c-type cytochrome n=1 Tax=Azospirillum sp. SYSU D00513 TaxID=2812561 RepID=UPI001A969CC2|nr:cytochrome c [Azospirillum sp. SYSU D00513]